MKPKREWYCLNCRKFVDVDTTGISIVGVTAQITCKECKLPFVMNLKEIKPEDLEKVVEEFKKQTEKL